ncbi:MAG: response regulator transcription factor [Chloroflexi bacterium]|nr:response regulator transcription factor [Chloroflexota bacterium]
MQLLQEATAPVEEAATVIRVVLVESSAVVRAALREFLARHGEGIAVVADMGDPEEAVQQVVARRPDVVVLDLYESVRAGWECAKRIQERAPGTRTILVSSGFTALSPQELSKAGVCGLLERSRLPGSLIEVIKQCAEGLCWAGKASES